MEYKNFTLNSMNQLRFIYKSQNIFHDTQHFLHFAFFFTHIALYRHLTHHIPIGLSQPTRRALRVTLLCFFISSSMFGFCLTKHSRCSQPRPTIIASVLVIFHTKTHENRPNTISSRTFKTTTIDVTEHFIVEVSFMFLLCARYIHLLYNSCMHSWPEIQKICYFRHFVF